ncbi:response regulator [Longimicrobium sp.]|uniref:response regulator n=1 Tax=Longimicrobium sp. TaxID=2029185 RepID=UPI002E2F409D|nr:response regulator [Longimicrobium sp.]HEX6039649.1 response regulator [Longimicrobium sp.]
MNKVLVAGLPPDVPGLLARRLAGAMVEDQPSPRDAADALRREPWTLAAVDASWLEEDDALVEAFARLRVTMAGLVVLVTATSEQALALGDTFREAGVARVFHHPLDREALVREAMERLGLGAPAPAAGGGAAAAGLNAAVASVWAKYRDQVMARVDVLESAALGLLEGRLDREARREAEREAHKLAGSVGTFGFAEASRLSREAETMLGGPNAPGQADALRLADLAVAIRQELSGTATPMGAAPAPPPPARPAETAPWLPGGPAEDGGPPAAEADLPTLLIVDEDRETASRLAMEAHARGLRPAVVHTMGEARSLLAAARPDAALLDISVEGGMELLRALSDRFPPVPSIVFTRSDAFTDRVEVARLGGRGFLRKPLAPARAIDAVEPLLKPDERRSATVLAVDDDPSILEAVRFVLEPHGVRVEALAEPERFWEALESSAPDVVLLDVDMPRVNGLELCRVLRNDPRWKSVPVVFLTSRADPTTVQAVFAAGADDFVSKPFVGPELGARIHNRLERVRLQRSLAETDALTGVPNRRGSEEVLERFLRLAAGQGDPLAFGIVDLDCFKQVNDRCGHAVGDEVLSRVARLLQKRFRAEDVVARWGGEEFVVGMYGMDKADGVQRLAEALEVLREEPFKSPSGEPFQVTFSAGVAEFDSDGRDLQSLYRAADAAMYAAKAAGRDRVLPSGWTPGQGEGPRTVDVLVVEDDPAIARLLQHALETRGLRHEWVDNGERAARLLTGTAPELRARAVLLDVDLPGLDGLGVLRVMARERLLERTRVIVLTVRTHEAEVVRALELGAFDHVSKPFSVPVLLQRIRRALRA